MGRLLALATGAAVMDGVKLLYNNDGENLWAVDSSGATAGAYHPRTGSAIDTDTIRGSARDVAGIADVDLICPFHNVPWWQSKLEPPAAHRAWYDKTFGFSWGGGGSQLDYVLKGGDFIGEFADECHSTGQTPFVTIRLNDGQMCSHPPTPDNCSSGVNNDHQFDRLSEFWWKHRDNASMILGLQQTPPEGFRPCCWLPHNKGGCRCTTAACEFSWAGSTLARDRVANLVGELAEMYVARGVHGISLDFERGLDYFAASDPLSERKMIIKSFLRGIRARIDNATNAARTAWAADHAVGSEVAGRVEPPAEVALGVRLTPRWAQLQQQGLDDLRSLVTPLSRGGEGVTYLNFGIFFWAFQPHDSEIASLAAAIPAGTKWYYEVSSWIDTARSTANCSAQGAKVRITQEELWTTALLAHSYGASGLSAFNFVYTRPYFDLPCQFELNQPYAEPLWDALNQTKDIAFVQRADQLYRIGHMSGMQQHAQAPRLNPTFLLVFVRPAAPAQWATIGRLRVLVSGAADRDVNGSPLVNVSAALNGVKLRPTTNVSSQYGEGTQATMALWPKECWRAFEVPSSVAEDGNNTIQFSISGGQAGEAGYTLTHNAAAGGDGKRWRLPAPFEPRSTVNGTSKPGVSLLECEQLCDHDQHCKGIYHSTRQCFALHELLADAHTSLKGQSYTKGRRWTTGSSSTQPPPVLRLEVSLPVVKSV